MTASGLSGIVGPTHWQRTASHFIETCVPWQGRHGYVRHRSTQHTSTQTQRNGKPSGSPLAAFACATSPYFVAKDGRIDTTQFKHNSGEATNDLLLVQMILPR